MLCARYLALLLSLLVGSAVARLDSHSLSSPHQHKRHLPMVMVVRSDAEVQAMKKRDPESDTRFKVIKKKRAKRTTPTIFEVGTQLSDDELPNYRPV